MSEPALELDDEPRRARQPRAEVVASTRRRRNAGSIDRMVQMKLDCIADEDLDLENYVYRWANDEGNRLRSLTRLDDYDFVRTDEIGPGFDPTNTDSESVERMRMIVGRGDNGQPTYAYLLKKPRSYWIEDNEAVVRNREDMMAGRVYRGEASAENESDDPTRYVPKGVKLGHAGERRRGPVPRTLK